MLEELIDFIESENKKGDEALANRLTSYEAVQISLLRASRQHYREWIKTAGTEAPPSDILEHILESDRGDMIPYLIASHPNKIDTSSSGELRRLVQTLVDTGLSDVLRSCVEVLRPAGAGNMSPELSTATWPADLHLRKKYGKPRSGKLFATEHYLFAGALEGHLFRACKRSAPSLEVIKVIVQELGCSRREKDFALSWIAHQPQVWHLKAVEYLVEHGADVDAQDPTGLTPLMRACEGDLEIPLRIKLIKLLLTLGANINIKDFDQATCLTFAAGSSEILKLLFTQGADPSLEASSVLEAAIEAGDVESVRLLIQRGIDFRVVESKALKPLEENDDRNDKAKVSDEDPVWKGSLLGQAFLGLGLLQRSASAQLPNMVETLLDGGADPFYLMADSSTLLHSLMRRGANVETILARPGLDLERRDKEGRTLLLAATSLDAFKSLVNKGVNLLATDLRGSNVLHCLIRNVVECSKSLELVDVILQHPKSRELLNGRDQDGHRPFQLALERECWITAKKLMDYGADITIVGPTGNTTYHGLFGRSLTEHPTPEAFERMVEIVEKLVAYQKLEKSWTSDPSLTALEPGETRSVDVNSLDRNGEPALFGFARDSECNLPLVHLMSIAANLDETRIPTGEKYSNVAARLVRLFKDAGLQFDVRSRDGRNALHAAAERNHGRKRMRDPDLEDDEVDGEVSPEMAEWMREIWKILVSQGLDPYSEDDEHRSALDIAATYGNVEILEMY